jgi:hypothetical protein
MSARSFFDTIVLIADVSLRNGPTQAKAAWVGHPAMQTGCAVLFSENMPQAREVDGVRIVNPFR